MPVCTPPSLTPFASTYPPVAQALWTPLHVASFNGHAGVVRTLLEGGASVDAVAVDTETPLIEASYGGHAQVQCRHSHVSVALCARTHA